LVFWDVNSKYFHFSMITKRVPLGSGTPTNR
jgi:hypothetical protein